MSINQALLCLKGLNDGGWVAQAVDPDALTQFPLAQFYCFSFSGDKSFVNLLSIDCFMKNVVQFNNLPENHFDSSELSGEVARLTIAVNNNQNSQNERDLAVALNAYMLTTKAGQAYFNTYLGMPFAFIAILYPANKEHTQFWVRPAVIGANEIMSTEDLAVFANQVAEIDLNNGHSEYFEFINKVKFHSKQA